MSVDVILTRNIHWAWNSDAITAHRGSYNRIMDPVLYEWIRSLVTRPEVKVANIYNNRNKNRSRNKNVVYIKFTNKRDARHFVLAWNIPDICIRTDEKWHLKVVDKELPKSTTKVSLVTPFFLSHTPLNELFILE